MNPEYALDHVRWDNKLDTYHMCMRTRIAINLFMAAPDAMKPSILIFFI